MHVLTSAPDSFCLLSSSDIQKIRQDFQSERYDLFRNCALTILDPSVLCADKQLIAGQFTDFEIRLAPAAHRISLELINPPAAAFVDGRLITTLQHNLYSLLRDIFLSGSNSDLTHHPNTSTWNAKLVSEDIFSQLRRANALPITNTAELIVCWGGHSIQTKEFEYAKEVGKQLGLRAFNICTGCGAGAMYAPMQGAAIGHRLQLYSDRRFIGLTEPSIIISEPPNSLINELVIMPDIEKRLEAFVRIAHGIIIFPGGVGTAEELLYLIGLLMHDSNRLQVLPLILTGPASSAGYFTALDKFIVQVLGEECRRYYQIIIDNPVTVAQRLLASRASIEQYRREIGDTLSYNWSLHIPVEFQQPFIPTHENMANLQLEFSRPVAELAVTLRRAFSGIVAGNIRQDTMQAVAQYGPFQLHGDPIIMEKMSEMLQSFITEGRITLLREGYTPCYELKTSRPICLKNKNY